MRHETLRVIPPFLVETILNMAGIPGESRDSGCNPGLRRHGKDEVFPNDSRAG